MLPAPVRNSPRSRRFSSATRSRSMFRGEKDRKLRLGTPGWDDMKVVQPDGCGQVSRGWKDGSYSLAGGNDDPPSKTRTPLRPPGFFQLRVPLTCIEPCIF